MRALTLPDRLGAGSTHWMSRWEQLHGFRRIEQHDWDQPRRGDWMVRLEESLLVDDGLLEQPALLVAHGLGCHLVAAWAAHSRHTHRVAGALLVAPPDTERDDLPPQGPGWRPMVTAALPFPSTLISSRDDPACPLERAGAMAQTWGACLVVVGDGGHLDAGSGLGDWPAGLAWLRALAWPARRAEEASA